MSQATLRVAVALNEQELASLEAQFSACLNQELHFVVELDPALVGGFVARINGRQYDFSVAEQLRQLRTGKGSLRDRLASYAFTPATAQFGTVVSVMDDVVQVRGLAGIRNGELLHFGEGSFGMAMELREDGAGVVMLSGGQHIIPGSLVQATNHVADIGVGNELLGRIITPIGQPLDGRDLHAKTFRALEQPAPSIMDRSPVNRPLETGLLAVDSMIPIGRGQRELIIGDRQTGKTAIALAAMINQRDENTYCVYCAIGQKGATVAQVTETLRRTGTLERTVVVAATANDRASLQYLAPYAGCAIAEHFMHQGKDVLIVYDDLSKHAQAYRSMSLLLRRPSGREAYPGDVFYLHSRLLERAARLSDEQGGGSITALPIVETMAGDISAYIPTNVISITDGQIYLESELFHAGVRPALNVGLSVSRVGRAAQHPAMRKVSGSLRLDLAQYRDTAVFAQFGADIDESTTRQLRRGERLTQLLRQRQEDVLPLEQQVAVLLAFEADWLEGVPAREVRAVRDAMLAFLAEESVALQHIAATGDLTDDDKEALQADIKRFMASEKAVQHAKSQ